MKSRVAAAARILFGIGAAFSVLIFIVGLLVRLTVRDRYDGWSVIFYATPWPVLTAFLIVPAIWGVTRGRRNLAVCFAMLALGCGCWWLSQSWFWNSPAVTGPPAFRFFFWNTAHPKMKLSHVMENARNSGADIIALAEVIAPRNEDLADWQKKFPDYTVRPLRGELMFLTRGEITSTEDMSLNGRGHCQILKVDLRGRKITVFLVDFSAHVLRSRRPPFERLYELIEEHGSEDLLVVGDFNCPRESVYFDPMRKTMAHAFEAAGSGPVETWPVPLPVLTLDHLWVSANLRVMKCSAGYSWMSDHRALTADFAE